jgi:hypothetical protein
MGGAALGGAYLCFSGGWMVEQLAPRVRHQSL